PDCVTKFNGDFAFALWDQPRGRLVLARDRMGVRPLFYASRKDALYFASEVKALLEVPGLDASLDPIALDQIFTFWFPLAPRTAFSRRRPARRTADPAYRAGTAVEARRSRSPQWVQGRADRRRRRRGVRRLRHFQGGKAAPLLCAAAALRPAAAAAPQALSLP